MDIIVFNEIRKVLQSKEYIDKCMYEDKILIPFLEEMGYTGNHVEWKIEKDNVYDYIYDDIILFRYYSVLSIDQALMDLSKELEFGRSYEWGILFHKEGIWLFNRDIVCGSESTEKDRVVLSVLFKNSMDRAYLDYMSYDNLVGSNQDAKYFADITEYKNKNYFKHNEKSWVAYVGALKRFLNYCANKGIHYSNSKYSSISFQNFEHYVKTSSKIKTENTAKAQFFYIKDFMVDKTGRNGDFNRSSADILFYCQNILRGENEEFVDIQANQIKELVDELANTRNGLRNITLLLMLVGMGIERRRICDLKWNKDISPDMTAIRIRGTDKNNEKVIMPRILCFYLKQLRMSEPESAIYVFGNWTTEYQVPVKEGSINGMLDAIANEIKNEMGINMITPAAIRRWLFSFLLENNYRLQDIMCMMNISVDNLGNYISNQQLKGNSGIYEWKDHPLDTENFFVRM